MATKPAVAKETITAGMSRWAAGLSYPQLSQEAVYQAKRFLLDSVGCALGGFQQHDVKIALAVLDEIAGAGLATVIAGAILADVGKLLEYELGADGKSRQSERGEALRHPFTGVALALECGVPDAVCHIIAAHAAEGDLVKRSTEAYIVHHADFMAFLPFKNPKNIKLK